MMAIGCIQAQKCHTDHCPVGIATQNPRYTRGLDVGLKSVRAANYIRSLRRDLLKVSEAIGVVHPGLIAPGDIDLLDGTRTAVGLGAAYGYDASWQRLGPRLVKEVEEIMVAQDATHGAAQGTSPGA
jgi:glutamate synthase (ferredoxin)